MRSTNFAHQVTRTDHLLAFRFHERGRLGCARLLLWFCGRFATSEESFNHVKRYRDQEDRDAGCSNHSADNG